MADLIDRQALLDTFDNIEWYSEYTEYKRKMAHGSASEPEPYIKWDDAIKTIEAAPTIEPKRGEWIRVRVGPYQHTYGMRCSHCDATYVLSFECEEYFKAKAESTHYCSNCGAYMQTQKGYGSGADEGGNDNETD